MPAAVRKRCSSAALIAAVLLSASFAAAAPQTACSFPSQRLPRAARSESAFVPGGWTMEDEREGDLFGEGEGGVALVLAGPAGGGGRRDRALVLLERLGDGSLLRHSATCRLLICTTCAERPAGVEAAPVNVSIDGHTLVVDWIKAGDEEVTLRFEYDGKADRFFLVEDEMSGTDAATGASITRKTDYRRGTVTENGKRRRGPKEAIPIDKVSFASY